MEGAFNRLTEDTAPRKYGDRTLCSNCWAARGGIITKHFKQFNCLSGVDSEVRGQAIGVQTQIHIFYYFFEIRPGVLVSRYADNLSSTLQYTHMS